MTEPVIQSETLTALENAGIELTSYVEQVRRGLGKILHTHGRVKEFATTAAIILQEPELKFGVTVELMTDAANFAINGIPIGPRRSYVPGEDYAAFLTCAETARIELSLWQIFTNGLFATAIKKSIVGKRKFTDGFGALAAFAMKHTDLEPELISSWFPQALEKKLADKNLEDLIGTIKDPGMLNFAKAHADLWPLITPDVIGLIITAALGDINRSSYAKKLFQFVEDEEVLLAVIPPAMVEILVIDDLNFRSKGDFMKMAQLANTRQTWASAFGTSEVANSFLTAHKRQRFDADEILCQLQTEAPNVHRALLGGVNKQLAEEKQRAAAMAAAETARQGRPESGSKKPGGNGGTSTAIAMIPNLSQ